MDIASAILNIYKIEGINIEDYKDIFTSDGKGFIPQKRKYRIKLDTRKNGVLIQDLRNSSVKMIKCVKEYYSPTSEKQTFENASCNDIIDRLELDIGNGSCSICHKRCIEKLELNELNRVY